MKTGMTMPALFIFSLLERHLPHAPDPPGYQPFNDRVAYIILAIVFVVAVTAYAVL